MLLRKALVSDREIEDNCLLGFVLWHDNPCVFMCMRDTTVSQKSQLNKVYVLLITLYTIHVRIMAVQLCLSIKG